MWFQLNGSKLVMTRLKQLENSQFLLPLSKSEAFMAWTLS